MYQVLCPFYQNTLFVTLSGSDIVFNYLKIVSFVKTTYQSGSESFKPSFKSMKSLMTATRLTTLNWNMSYSRRSRPRPNRHRCHAFVWCDTNWSQALVSWRQYNLQIWRIRQWSISIHMCKQLIILEIFAPAQLMVLWYTYNIHVMYLVIMNNCSVSQDMQVLSVLWISHSLYGFPRSCGFP